MVTGNAHVREFENTLGNKRTLHVSLGCEPPAGFERARGYGSAN